MIGALRVNTIDEERRLFDENTDACVVILDIIKHNFVPMLHVHITIIWKLVFYVPAITFLLLVLANCVRDKSGKEKITPIYPKGPKFVAQADCCIHR